MNAKPIDGAEETPKLSVHGLTKHFGELVAVDNISFSVDPGELVCILGPSGCGKSTTLRMIAGLERPTDGNIYLDGDDQTDIPPYERPTATVFQNWALFPYKSVLENVAFGLKMDGVNKKDRQNRAQELLRTVQMEPYADAKPPDLSGGQKQRVALSRALAVEPELLLLDEPLSNLDKKLRESMQIEIRKLQDQFDKTMIYVTHDQTEAFTLADRLFIMNNGKIMQRGTPQEIYEHPVNEFVESFLGDTNFISGSVESCRDNTITIATSIGEAIEANVDGSSLRIGETVSLSIRPEEITIGPDDTSSVNSTFKTRGSISNILHKGSVVRYYVSVNGSELFTDVELAASREIDQHEEISIACRENGILLFHNGEILGRV